MDDVRADQLDRLIPSGIPENAPFGPRTVPVSFREDPAGTGVPGAIDDPSMAGAVPQELRPLVQLASDMRRSLSPAPAEPTLRGRVWARLAPRLGARQPSTRRNGWMILRPAYALASLAVVVVLALGTTTAYASEAALPGDVLYPVKRSLEQARLALSTTPAGDARLMASFVDRRMAEIEDLSVLGRWDDVDAALSAYADGIDVLAGTEPTGIEAQLSRHLEVLERVRRLAPESAQPGLDRAQERAAHRRQETREREQDKKPSQEAPGREKKEIDATGDQDGAGEDGPRRPGGLPPGWEKKLTPTP